MAIPKGYFICVRLEIALFYSSQAWRVDKSLDELFILICYFVFNTMIYSVQTGVLKSNITSLPVNAC